MSLTFLVERHQYLHNGTEIPSVSRILQGAGLVDYQGIPDQVLAYAAYRGQLAHQACDLWDQGVLDVENLDRQLVGYVAAWQSFRIQNPCQIVASEKIYLGEVGGLKYGMTLDRLVRFEGQKKGTILDLKTSREIKPWHSIQLAGYALGVSPRWGTYQREIVRLASDGTFERRRCEDPQDAGIFSSALQLYYWKTKNRA